MSRHAELLAAHLDGLLKPRLCVVVSGQSSAGNTGRRIGKSRLRDINT
jgi:hypothetical protein